MRLICLNVALFETNNHKLFKFLKQQNADIICLQEIADSTDGLVSADYISKELVDKATDHLKHSFFTPNSLMKDFHQKSFHKKEIFYFDFGGWIVSGNYIKTKYKILKAGGIFLKNKYRKITDWENWPSNETKSVQVVDLDLGKSGKLRVLNYHGIWTKEKVGNQETLRACQEINDLAAGVEYPSIIVGDFNLFPDTDSMKVFKEFKSLVDEYSIKTTRPKINELSSLKRNIVDYILISNKIKINSFKVLDSDVSDHLPLILDFEIEA